MFPPKLLLKSVLVAVIFVITLMEWVGVSSCDQAVSW